MRNVSFDGTLATILLLFLFILVYRRFFFLTHEEEGLKIVQHEQEAIEHSFLHAARDI